MKRFPLSNTEARAWHDGRLSVVLRKIRPQPVFVESSCRWIWHIPKRKINNGCCSFVCDASRRWWEYLTENQFPYRPGQEVFIGETWGVGCRPDHVFGWRDGIEYKADIHFLEENDILDLYPVREPYESTISEMKVGWRSPVTMPEWASRSKAVIVGVRPEQIVGGWAWRVEIRRL